MTTLLTIRDICEDGRFSSATFYRLAKNDPRFPPLLKIGGSTRVQSKKWQDYVARIAGEVMDDGD